MSIIHVGEGFLEFALLEEMPRIREVRAGHSKEVLGDLPQMRAGRREISSAIAVVRPSTLAMIAFRSFGFVTFRMICVLHWLRTFLSTLAARCVITTSPRPNLRPSEASVRNTFEEAAWPT